MKNPVRQTIAAHLSVLREMERKYGEHRTVIGRNKYVRYAVSNALHVIGIGWPVK